MPQDVLFWLLAVAATLLVGASKGGLPLVGMLGVPLMALYISPVVAAGLLLPLYIVSDMYGLWLFRREFDLRNLLILVPAATVGIGTGWATASITDENMVKLLVGAIGLIYCADAVLKARRKLPPRPADVPRGLFWGAITGFTSFVSHAGAPPYQMYVLPQRLPKMVYAGTSTIAFAFINLLKLPPYWMLGQVNTASLKTGLALAPAALFGAWLGYRLTKILPEQAFYRIVEVALLLVSVKLIYDALHALVG
jgi:uncharacterized membrane protein YfcA